ncbi:MAG: serine/threonine-protein kinase [Velocimicrobium sp.]
MRCKNKIRKGAFVYTIIWFNKYCVIQKLGQGSSGTVFLALHEKLQVYRAIKQIPKEESHTQWINETNILKILRHPNIPIIYDIEEDEKNIYIIEEYIEGQSLRAYKLSQINISESKLLDFLIQLSEVLDFLHSFEHPILYLDLKPDNIIITQENQLKLVDFGTAKVAQNRSKGMNSYGTPGYAAPEQYGMCAVDKRSDVYGLGSILFFLAMGVSYKGRQKELKKLEYASEYSRALIQILSKCLKYDPADRYSSVDVVKKEAMLLKQAEEEVHNREQTPHIIKIAGVIPRIGTTHISLMITTYLNQIGIPALYVEQNDAHVVEKIKSCINQVYLKKTPMVRGDETILMQRYKEIKVFICDCGIWKSENDVFLSGNQHFLVFGSKPWEWVAPQETFKGMCLINFIKSEDFLYLTSHLNKMKAVRVPFVPDYLLPGNNRYTKEFLQEILHDVLEKKKQKFFL